MVSDARGLDEGVPPRPTELILAFVEFSHRSRVIAPLSIYLDPKSTCTCASLKMLSYHLAQEPELVSHQISTLVMRIISEPLTG